MPEEPLVWSNSRRKVNELIPLDFNPRILTEKQAADLKASLAKFNLVEVPAINLDNRVLAGHQRLRILALLGRGQEEIDVRIPNRQLSEEEVKEYCIRSNKNTGEWDYDALSTHFEVTDLLAWGFTDDELGMGSAGPDESDDDTPDAGAIVTPFSVVGDIYEITTPSARLRLMCGDSKNIDALNLLMAGEQAHMIWTDPPWNVSYGADQNHPSWRPRTIMNDSMSQEDFLQFLRDIFASMSAVARPGAMVYVAMSAQEWGTIMQAMQEAGFHWSSTIIWKKDRLVMSRKDYHTQYEPLWYGWKEGEARLKPLEDRQQSDVWDIDRPSRSDQHPTMKPVELITRSIENSSERGWNILDHFNGSGSTGVACLKTSRNYYGMELEPRYIDSTLQRWTEFMTSNGINYTLTRNAQNFTVPAPAPEPETNPVEQGNPVPE